MNESNITTNSDGKGSKAEQLIQQFYAKTAQILIQSRLNPASSTTSRRNKWFNLELEDYEPLKEELKYWKSQLGSGMSPPLIIDILLDISKLNASHSVILTTSGGRRHRIQPEELMGLDSDGQPVKKTMILLETWQLSLLPDNKNETHLLPTVYKKSIIFFRSLYSYIRSIPVYKFSRRINTARHPDCKISYRVSSQRTTSPYEAGLDELHPSSNMEMSLSESLFESLETPMGVFSFHGTFRMECEFSLDERNMAMDAFDDGFFNPKGASSYDLPFQSGSKPSVVSSHFIPFTPPNNPPMYTPLLNEALPFSKASLTDATKFVLQPLVASSPPFAILKNEVKTLPLSTIRRPSYVFPTSSPNTNNMSSLVPNTIPSIFTPSSSITNPYFKSTSTGSTPPNYMNMNVYGRQSSVSDAEIFLNNLESSLRISNGSVMKGSKQIMSSSSSSALTKLKSLRKANMDFTILVSKSEKEVATAEAIPTKEVEIEIPFARQLSRSYDRSYDKEWKPKGKHPFEYLDRSDLVRRRSITTDIGNIYRESLVVDGSSRERGRQSEDDELLFDMSEIT